MFNGEQKNSYENDMCIKSLEFKYWKHGIPQCDTSYSQMTGKDRPTKALDRYSVYISLATPSR